MTDFPRDWEFRSIEVWPHGKVAWRPSPFSAPWSRTMLLLDREIRMLGGKHVVVGMGYSEHEIRLDGRPRANARAVRHPGVEISFDSKFGRLVYATAEYADWHDNVRAIALSLEALRQVDRYGVAKRGEQYAGWALLAMGEPLAESGRKLVERYGSVSAALRATHPDTRDAGMTDRDFQAVTAFRDEQKAIGVGA